MNTKTVVIRCTGEDTVDYRQLHELQIDSTGRSLKRTDDAHIRRLADSIAQHGLVNNLQLWQDPQTKQRYCFDAHHRKKALALLDQDGWTVPPLPCTRVLADSRTEAQRLLLLKESSASWIDTDVITKYMHDIDFDICDASDLIDLPGIDWDTLDIADGPAGTKATDDEIADKPTEADNTWNVQRGQLWQLGSHRLLCGDATSVTDVSTICDGTQPDTLLIDPPFDIPELYNVIPPYTGDSNLFAFYDYKRCATATYAAMQRDWPPRYEFIWDCCQSWYTPNRPLARHKAVHLFGPDVPWQFDAALIKDDKKRKAGSVTNTKGTYNYQPLDGFVHLRTVEPISNASLRDEHGHGKPLKWIEALLKGVNAHTVLDYFCGSGTFLYACHNLQIPCYAIELDPTNVSTILSTYQRLFGIKPTLI